MVLKCDSSHRAMKLLQCSEVAHQPLHVHASLHATLLKPSITSAA